jgi:hypothetical protein
MLKLDILTLAGALATMTIAGGGCGMFSASNAPVDCNIVKTQAAAGVSDADIASNLQAKESEVAACHGAMSSNQTSVGNVPTGNY